MQRVELAERHQHRTPKTLGQPPHHTGMVTVEMSANHRFQRQAGHDLDKNLLPYVPALVAVEAGIDRHPTVAMAQQIQIDMIQTERQRHPQP